MRVLVVGAGVIGLTCAVRLREAGYDAHVLARDLPLETTSAVAAALWYPYRAYPAERVLRWSELAYTEFERLAWTDDSAGIRMRWGTEVLPASREPWWKPALAGRDALHRVDAPAGYADAWRIYAPIADTSVYLPWLVRRLNELGGTLSRAWLSALPPRGVVVNCTGLSACALTDDPGLKPVRGQVVYVEQVGLDEWWLAQGDEAQLTYVVPRQSDIVVGGTADEDVYDLRPDRETTKRIIDRAVERVPALHHARILGTRVGLRPARANVRLETEEHSDGAIVHCYGHGGAGITVSWGCADDVVMEIDGLTGSL